MHDSLEWLIRRTVASSSGSNCKPVDTGSHQWAVHIELVVGGSDWQVLVTWTKAVPDCCGVTSMQTTKDRHCKLCHKLF